MISVWRVSPPDSAVAKQVGRYERHPPTPTSLTCSLTWQDGGIGRTPLWSALTTTDAWKSWRKVTAMVTHARQNVANTSKPKGFLHAPKTEGGLAHQKCSFLAESAKTNGQDPPKRCRKNAKRCESVRVPTQK